MTGGPGIQEAEFVGMYFSFLCILPHKNILAFNFLYLKISIIPHPSSHPRKSERRTESNPFQMG